MRTFAARQEDLNNGRYKENEKYDVFEYRQAKLLLSQKESKMLASQALRLIYQHEGIGLLALPAGEHIILALETLGLVEIGRDKSRTVCLTDKGLGMAQAAQ